MTLIATNKYTVVLGLGATGLSAARYLVKKGINVIVLDSRENPPNIDSITAEVDGFSIECGPLDADLLREAQEIVISPGLSRKLPAIKAAIDAGVPSVGDIELFAREVKVPVIGITGSNGKSTVTTLVGAMAKASGLKTIVAGNIGKPVLDTLNEAADIYILELSSFQLESTSSLKPKVATILNISADHMDRYDSFMEYALTKQRIAFGAEVLIINKDDVLSAPPIAEGVKTLTFTQRQPDLRDYGVANGYLVKGFTRLIATDELRIKGQHNLINAAAALAISEAAGFPQQECIEVLKTFKGLAHRCEYIIEMQGIVFINDSKATNVGATVAALNGLKADSPNIHIILGGDGKGADFSPLMPALKASAKSIVTLGKDAPVLNELIQSKLPDALLSTVTTMHEAVTEAYAQAQEGDIILLSPACASLDMFNSFEARGKAFAEVVKSMGSIEEGVQ